MTNKVEFLDLHDLITTMIEDSKKMDNTICGLEDELELIAVEKLGVIRALDAAYKIAVTSIVYNKNIKMPSRVSIALEEALADLDNRELEAQKSLVEAETISEEISDFLELAFTDFGKLAYEMTV